jgi:hypothetical protein
MGHIFDSPFMKPGQNACLGNCSDEFDGSGERSRAIMALLFSIGKRKKSQGAKFGEYGECTVVPLCAAAMSCIKYQSKDKHY